MVIIYISVDGCSFSVLLFSLFTSLYKYVNIMGNHNYCGLLIISILLPINSNLLTGCLKPLNKKNTLAAILKFTVGSSVERLSSWRFKMYRETTSDLCSEVYRTESLSRRVHYRRFYCTCTNLYSFSHLYPRTTAQWSVFMGTEHQR